jgi:hypothetical protein
MNPLHYTIAAYVLVGGLVWGYAVCLVLQGRALKRRELRAGVKP